MRERKISFQAEAAGRDKHGLREVRSKDVSGCLPSLMQLVILFGLYPVVQNIPEYVTKVRNVYLPLVDKIQATKGYQDIMKKSHLL